MPTSELPSDGTLRVRVTDDFVLDGGAWKLTEDQKGRPVARITPPTTPMFQQIIAYLEAKPVPRGGSSRRADEARAAVAVCLRWGSYFAVLADPSRPDSYNINDEQVSQIDNEEMARMNIEISAALAWWLSLFGSDDRRHRLPSSPTNRWPLPAILAVSENHPFRPDRPRRSSLPSAHRINYSALGSSKSRVHHAHRLPQPLNPRV
jgi:hypothetical protein